MKVQKHTLISRYGDLVDFAQEHIGETFTIHSVTPEYVNIMQEVEQTEAETHMQVLRTQLECDEYLTEEEKAAIEYSIECIKTLDDMGILKGEHKQ